MSESVSGLNVFAKWFLGAGAVLLVGVSLFNWFVDPLQFYHRSFLTPIYFENQRYQNPGIAKNFDYDTVVIGNSHTENFTREQMERAFGFKMVSLSISGSTAREQRLVLEKALETGKVKNVFWGIDYAPFRNGPLEVRGAAGEFPMHLYTENILTPFRYLMSMDTLEMSADTFLGDGYKDLEGMRVWTDRFEYGVDRVERQFRTKLSRPNAFQDSPPRVVTDRDGARYLATIDTNLVEIISRYPEVKFYFFTLPFSIAIHMLDYKMGVTGGASREQFKTLLFESLVNFPNVRIFDFEPWQSVTHQFENYKDMTHYRIEVNEEMLVAMSRHEMQVDPQNIKESLRALANQQRTFLERACKGDGARTFCVKRPK